MKHMLLAATLMCGLATGTQAVPVTYTLVGHTYDAFTVSIGAFLNVTFTVQDTAVSRGTFTLTGTSGAGPGFTDPAFTGDVADFVSYFANEAATPMQMSGTLSINATFQPDGSLGPSTFRRVGVFEALDLSGDVTAFGGTFGSDNFSGRCGNDLCKVAGQITGDLQQVPEPASIALLAFCAFIVAVVRRRVRQIA